MEGTDRWICRSADLRMHAVMANKRMVWNDLQEPHSPPDATRNFDDAIFNPPENLISLRNNLSFTHLHIFIS